MAKREMGGKTGGKLIFYHGTITSYHSDKLFPLFYNAHGVLFCVVLVMLLFF